ncbi:ABC transporter permease [Clostridium perfringens]|uniref:ABC transporter permease n=1 Tax=Clostridium perfringens TaxID=1502 RepID=UPI00016BD74F|nr:ABC transporter permease [Clostridium perfringens]EDT27271.1 putative ABC transporter, permease protein [Clostridium perfringens CPE str. F4969]EGT0681567.1 FtsX-like permease family protein [Clostridium perfringens]ELC8370826.1 FtsX-like permease family protein [Clostridium perfringens]ELC8372777.1 FtsX-like permease family protein [Clostridium perfringens]MBO3395176.1 FtsX-like permease family protein [Clostridium perfringens]
MYFKLAFKNIKKSYKNYVIYFLTLIFGICIFYTFNSIESQSVMMELNEQKQSAFMMAEQLIGYFSVFIAFVLGFLIVYANNYLIKRRKKEFGIYMTLGMENGSLSKMIFLETLFIGAISLGIGVVLGIMLSQALSVLTAYMFQVDLTEFQFVFSPLGFKRTVLCFSIIYLVVLIFNFISARKIKLIDLLTASKRNEKPTIKNLWVSVILFLVSVGILGTAYYKVIHDGIAFASFNALGLPILLGCIGTFIFFYSLTGFFLKVIQGNKKFYLRDLNMFVMKQISSKINTTFVSLSFICLMLFLAICTFSGGLGINRAINADLKDLTKFDVTFWSNSGENIENLLKEKNIDISNIAKEDSNMVMYDSGVKYSNFLSKEGMTAMKNYFPVANDNDILVIGENGYNNTLKLLGKEPVNLKENKYLAVGNIDEMKKWVNESLENGNIDQMKKLVNKSSENGKKINISGKTLEPANKKYENINLYNFTMKGDILILVVKDSLLEGLKPVSSRFNMMLKDNSNTKEELESIRDQLVESQVYSITKKEIYDNAAGLGATMAYLGIYLGLIFIITSAVVLAIQQLTESTDNVERYRLLKEIGVDQKMINKAIFTQVGVYFMLPLSLAIVHSIVGLKISSTIVGVFGNASIMPNIIITAIIFVIIYGGYFLATYLGAKKNINERS